MSVLNTLKPLRITLIGSGNIGLSLATFYITQASNIEVSIYNPKPDLEDYICRKLPGFLQDPSPENVKAMLSAGRLRLATDLSSAVKDAHIVQEQVPENVALKQKLWGEIEKYASPTCLFWSSTSGIPSSTQSIHMSGRERLLVAHPINPPHVMPLIEIGPPPGADPAMVARTVAFWKALGKVPVVLKKEVTGFVANRLAFALFREAIHLVDEDVVDVQDIDRVMENSMGIRWARAGPFKSYEAGGGDAGIEGLMKNIGKMMQDCWNDQGKANMGEPWEEKVYEQTRMAYRK